MSDKHRIAVIGSERCGLTIAKLAAENAKAHPRVFDMNVVFGEVMLPTQEVVDTAGLWKRSSATDDLFGEVAISMEDILDAGPRQRSHIKYANKPYKLAETRPGAKIPDNIIANHDLPSVVREATLLIFDLPPELLPKALDEVQGHHLPYARAISCIQGVDLDGNMPKLYSQTIMERLGIYCGSLSGTTIAKEAAAERSFDITVGYNPPPTDLTSNDRFHQPESRPTRVNLQPMPQELPDVTGELWQQLFLTPHTTFRAVQNVTAVEMGGALKNVVALGRGFIQTRHSRSGYHELTYSVLNSLLDGMNDSAVDREEFEREVECSMGGINHRSACHAVDKGVSIREIEKSELGGRELQGGAMARLLGEFLSRRGKGQEYPVVGAIRDIVEGAPAVDDLEKLLQ